MSTSVVHSAEFRVLLALADGPKHGHGIKLEIRDRTGGTVDMGPGTLYGAIRRLASRGWIREADRDERRQYFAITSEGDAALRAEIRNMEELLGVAAEKHLTVRSG